MVEWSRCGVRYLVWLGVVASLALSVFPVRAAQQDGIVTRQLGDFLLTISPPEGVDGKRAGDEYWYGIHVLNTGNSHLPESILVNPDGWKKRIRALGPDDSDTITMPGRVTGEDVASGLLTVYPGLTLTDEDETFSYGTGEFSFPFVPPVVQTDIELAPVLVAPAMCDDGIYQPPSITMPPASDAVSYWLEPATTGFAPGQAFTAYAQWNPDLYTAITDGSWILAGEPGYASQAISLPGCWTAGLLAGFEPAAASFSFPAETIGYAITATNAGEATVSGLSVTVGAIAVDSLLPGESAIIARGVHEVTAADIENGHVTLTATITGTDAASGPVKVTVEMRLTYLPPPPVDLPLVPGWTEASCDGTTPGRATITLPLDESGLISFAADPPGETGRWLPGQVVTITATLPEGRVFGNLAEGWDPDPADPTRATFTIPLEEIDCVKATISLAKTIVDGQPAYAAGETVRYALVATNTGNVDLSGVVVTDDLVDDLACDGTAIAPGKEITCTASYPVSQEDIDDGTSIINLAAVAGTAPDGTTQASDTASVVAHIEDHAPAISLVQSTDPARIDAAGQEIAYTFTVANEGNVTLEDIAINAPMLAAAGRDVTCAATSLAPTTQTECTAMLIVDQGMLDDGTPITSVATASATLPGGGTIGSSQATTEVPIHQRPGIRLEKTVIRVTSAGIDREIAAGERATGLHVGDTVTYGITATNSGNVGIEDVTIRDGMLSDLRCDEVVSLAPGNSVACTGTYTLVVADAARWPGITNTATVTASAPGALALSESASVTIWPVVPAPSLEVTLTPDRERYASIGHVIGYAITVKNTGPVAVTNLQLSTDGLTLDTGCEMPEVLEPGDPLACDGEYEVTQAALDAGSHAAGVNVTGEGPDGTSATASDRATTVGTQSPALAFSTRISEVNGVSVTSPVSGLEAGDAVTYTLVATNTGNVTLANAAITDSLLEGGFDCTQPVPVAPGSSLTCTATRTITQEDVDRGVIANEAGATATAPDGSPLVKSAALSVDTVAAAPGISLVTTAPPDAAYRAGDVLAWAFEVTNSGNVTVADLAVANAGFDARPISCPATTIAPGDTVTCTATLVITQERIEEDRPIMNEATASGLAARAGDIAPRKGAADPRLVTAPPSSSEVQIILAPALMLAIDASTPPGRPIAAGTVVTWEFRVTNSGNITLREIIVSDGVTTSLQGDGAPHIGTLVPGESRTGRGTSALTASDIKAGQIVNRAVANASIGVVSPEATLTLPLAGSGIPAPTPTPPAKPTPTPSDPADPAPDPGGSEPTPTPAPAPTPTGGDPADPPPVPPSGGGAGDDPDPAPPAGAPDPAPGEEGDNDRGEDASDPDGNDPESDDASLSSDPEITTLPTTGRGAPASAGPAWLAVVLAALVLAPAALRLRHYGEE